MREIKFRGRVHRNSTNKTDQSFVYGYYKKESSQFFNESAHYIIQEGISFRIILETLSQFTGLKDKNGKEIYEGDIIAYPKSGYKDYKTKVIWNNDWLRYETKDGLGFSMAYGVEVIGNIYENPELLEVKK